MSTACPETWVDVSGVATHRAAAFLEPYFEIASRRSRSWYAGERQPLVTKISTPSPDAATAARRRAASRSGSRLATPATSPSKVVVPSGTTPSASPSAPVRSGRGTTVPPGTELAVSRSSLGVSAPSTGMRAATDADEDADWDEVNGMPRKTVMTAPTTSRPATRMAGIRRVAVRVGRVSVTPPVKPTRRCRGVWGSRYATDMGPRGSIGACVC